MNRKFIEMCIRCENDILVKFHRLTFCTNQKLISSWDQVEKSKTDLQENGEKEIRVLGSEGIVVNALNLRPCASCRQSQTFKLDLGRQKS